MNYWNMQLHPNDMNWNKEEELLRKYGLIVLGDWDEAASQQPYFEKEMSIGDYVMIKHGGTIIALVKVIGNYHVDENTNDLLWSQKRRRVVVLDWYNDAYNYSVTPRKTLERCVIPNTGMYKSINDWVIKSEKVKRSIGFRNYLYLCIEIMNA